ncbi:hypothetical protein BGZ61DRAFT_53868 [Ilyonectria robusta]|uniref:uncharacterized protein n=1 Tax=Ilyonectria robusta TaxID=1079257 RepID=UPI001E8EB16D|nr:uncharacterized protein BGZ61DRAFT_53868 [Ilyonectria robusta]KAH8686582.1 hypothetical protein BGZ61DRAFT_53868 [Ilyonectria robusta]
MSRRIFGGGAKNELAGPNTMALHVTSHVGQQPTKCSSNFPYAALSQPWRFACCACCACAERQTSGFLGPCSGAQPRAPSPVPCQGQLHVQCSMFLNDRLFTHAVELCCRQYSTHKAPGTPGIGELMCSRRSTATLVAAPSCLKFPSCLALSPARPSVLTPPLYLSLTPKLHDLTDCRCKPALRISHGRVFQTKKEILNPADTVTVPHPSTEGPPSQMWHPMASRSHRFTHSC